VNILAQKRPIVLGEEPSLNLEGGGQDVAELVRVRVNVEGVRVVVGMTPNEARDLGCMLISAALSEAQALERAHAARMTSILGVPKQ
jgi:hypothetical protein